MENRPMKSKTTVERNCGAKSLSCHPNSKRKSYLWHAAD